jgi:hypothetical protein
MEKYLHLLAYLSGGVRNVRITDFIILRMVRAWLKSIQEHTVSV